MQLHYSKTDLLDTLDGRTAAAMEGASFWERIISAHRFAIIPKVMDRPAAVESHLDSNENGRTKHYQDIHLDGMVFYLPRDNIKPSAAAFDKLLRDSLPLTVERLHNRTTVEQLRLFSMLESWIMIMTERWTEELGAQGCNQMILEQAHLTLEDAKNHRDVYESLVIQVPLLLISV